MDLTHGSLFSGIGGFDLGFERVGIQTLWQVECDPYCLKVLEKHWPNVKRYTDVRTFLNEGAEQPEILSGGFPCQPFSRAGQRRGREDDRHLWPSMLAAIERLRPSWVIGENVLGILDMELDRCISDLESCGYATRPFAIPALAVDAKQPRPRIWIVAYDETRRLSQWPTATQVQQSISSRSLS